MSEEGGTGGENEKRGDSCKLPLFDKAAFAFLAIRLILFLAGRHSGPAGS
jgi:hypothetical protein